MRTISYDVADLTLASQGEDRIAWAERDMPVLRQIRTRFEAEKPLVGQRIAACLHVTTETANLVRTLIAGGAQVALCASNPLSTQDDVAAALARSDEVQAYCIKGEDNETYYRHIRLALDANPTVTMDDGADTVGVIHNERRNLIKAIIGGTEETTTGVIRLRAMAKDGVLAYPIIAVNDALTKHLFDNRYGTGQSTIDGILRATNVLIAGRVVVIAGYGWCGRGIATRAKGLGAHVIITEIDATKALEAVMDGFEVAPMAEAAMRADIVITVTGNKNVVSHDALKRVKDGAILCNSGHFNSEIDLEALEAATKETRRVREYTVEYKFNDGRRVFLLGDGRLINLAAAEGHPASVMDMSFANQALCVEHLVNHSTEMAQQVYSVPEAIDSNVAKLKLASLGVEIDTLTEEQHRYLGSWQEGT